MLAEKVGNKAANLMVRQEHAKANGYDIPTFAALSDDQIKNLFKEQGVDIEVMWSKVIHGYEESLKITSPENATDSWIEYINKANKPGGLLRDLKEQIVAISNNENFQQALQGILNGNGILLNDNSGKLIARSSGAEDSKEAANQGGNESLDCERTKQSVASALCNVVASYFTDRSIGQRAVAGESIKSLNKLPQLSLLVQELICETGLEDTPSEPGIISGVAFMPEPTLDCEEILVINCTYGHNRAVVESLLPCDTYYVTPEGQYFATVPIKDLRKAPKTSDASIDEVPNSQKAANLPCLDADQVAYLGRICKAIRERNCSPLYVNILPKNLKSY